MSSTTLYLKLKLASPVHIGTGEVYEPMNFVVDKENGVLISFDPADFLSSLSSDELNRYSEICRQGTVESIQDLYKFMRSYRHLAEGERINLSSGFIAHYEDTLDKPKERFKKELNNFQIKRTYFNLLDNRPVIPGSSIKGAVRTAVLNSRQVKQQLPRISTSKDLQKKLLGGDFSADPFSLVKVSDFIPVGEVKRRIVYAVDRKKRPKFNESRNLYQIVEVVEPGTEFFGHLTIIDPPVGRRINDPLNFKEVSRAMYRFYLNEKKREDLQLAAIKVKPANLDAGHNQLPVRLGRYSGAECVTVDGQRRIKISAPGKRPEKHSKNEATTVWLSSLTGKPARNDELQPMGWATLSLLSDDELHAADRAYEQYLTQLKWKCREIVEEQALEAVRLKEEKRVKEEKQQKERKKAEADEALRREEETLWEAMTQEERDLATMHGEELAKKMAPEIEVVRDIWPKVESDETDPEHRRNLAQAFMELWQAQKKWKVKPKQKKQYKKVKTVKEILGIS